ncbi:DUF7210 family protein [Pseudomonas asplenii]|uniref:DUF7210 domain-containing protein n=1 Tax=Pseudomonas asplenii TaxID=53407 RepID=A0A1H6P0W9_9PSED|nr:hypothetical protein [Pseudomonas fuscovaginae]SEI17209.1 hypothetical protein SAMN05216581_3331 [Pseudomonas fuscovaginae]
MKQITEADELGGISAAPVPEGIRVTLLKPHTHARVDYLAGAELTLTAEQVEWLKGLGVVSEQSEK